MSMARIRSRAIVTAVAGGAAWALSATPSLPLAIPAIPHKTGSAPTGVGTLVITTTSVPTAKVRVRISGRHAPGRPVRIGSAIRLKAGQYVVRPLAVKVPGGTRHPTRRTLRLTVRPGRATRIRIAYPTLVSAAVHVIPAKAGPGTVTITSGDLTLPAAVGSQIRTGQVLVSGPTNDAPDGFIRRVKSVTESGGTVRIATEPATLQDAVPEGRIDVHLASDGSLTGDSVVDPTTASQLARLEVTRSVDYSHDLLASGARTRGACSATFKGLKAKGEASITAGLDFTASWGPVSGVKADFQADLTAKARVALEAGLSAGCAGEYETPIARLPRIKVMVGTVPVWLTPFVQGTASAEIQGGIDATYGINYTATVSGGFHYEDGKIQPRASGSQSLEPETPSLKDLTGTAKVSGGPRFGVLFYDLAGPTVTVTADAGLTVAPFARPWWALDAGVTAKVGGKFRILTVDKNFEKEAFRVTRRLADSGQSGPPSSGPASPTVPSPSPVPATPAPAPAPGTASNTPPTARFTWTRATGRDVVSLDGRLSSDPDGRIAAYEWSVNGRVMATGGNPVVALGSSGAVALTLKVIDDRGGMGVVTHTIGLTNRPPTITAVAPAGGVVPGTQPTLSAQATDPDLDPISFNYRVTGPSVDVSSSWTAGAWQVPAHRLDPGTTYTWTVTARDGTTEVSRSANFTVAMLPTAADVVSTPSGAGYWQVDTFGGVTAFGDAHDYGDLPRQGVAVQNVLGMARTPTGLGYWLVGRDGGVFSFGDAKFYGSLPALGVRINNIVAMAVTRSGRGYWLVGADGGVFTFGDAPFYGSLGGQRLNAPVDAIAVTTSGAGYWLAARDGGVFTFGDAPFYGSLANAHLNLPVVDLEATPDGRGYWMAAEDGGVFAFGNAKFYGSLADIHLSGHITGMARTASGDGYWLTGCDGGLFTFGDAVFLGANPVHQCRGT